MEQATAPRTESGVVAVANRGEIPTSTSEEMGTRWENFLRSKESEYKEQTRNTPPEKRPPPPLSGLG